MLPAESYSQRNARLFGTEQPVAFITGSASPRVGRRIAEYLFAQNFAVMLHSHEPSSDADDYVSQLRQQGYAAHMVVGRVEEEVQVADWRDTIINEFGRIDVLVNSAAIWDPIPLEEIGEQDWLEYFRVNTLGTALCCRHFGLAMAEQASGGALVNIGDWAVARPYRDFSAYFTSKGSLITLTQTLAVELATRNPQVRVNAVLPGPVKFADGISDDRRQQIINDCLLRREGTADDVAQAVVFLATQPFITGVALPVDGGRTIYAGPTADSVAHPDIS